MFEDHEIKKEMTTEVVVSLPIAYTKDAIADSVENFIQELEDSGEGNVLQQYSKVTALIEYLTGVKKGMTELVKDEVEKYEDNVASANGIKMSVSTSPSKYSYDHYQGWVEQNTIVNQELDKLKKIEGMMKKAEGTAGIVDEETGELIPGRVVAKSGSSIIRASIPKS